MKNKDFEIKRLKNGEIKVNIRAKSPNELLEMVAKLHMTLVFARIALKTTGINEDEKKKPK
jgi:hypothetical protein